MRDLEELKKQASKVPNKPGVYFWRDKSKRPLYIGRAGSLKKRVQSYFRTRDSRISEMIEVARSITYEETDTLLEAIVLEANLIKKYWPKYNVREKDDKSFIYLVITNDDFARLIVVRGRELEKYSTGKMKARAIFGPYQSYWLLRKALDLVRRIFPYSTDKKETGKPCFHYQIGLCPGVCVGGISRVEYRKNIQNLILFFRGQKKQLLTRLKKQGSKNQIKALSHINDVALLADSDVLLRQRSEVGSKRIEGYDISHLNGKNPVGAMVVFEAGEKNPAEYRLFKIRGNKTTTMHRSGAGGAGRDGSFDDLAMLSEVVERRMKHREWSMPDIVFVDGGLNQVRAVNRVLIESKLYVPVVGLSKAGKHAGSAYAGDKMVIINAGSIGKDLLLASKKLFQEVRNEVHRVAIGFQRKQRRQG